MHICFTTDVFYPVITGDVVRILKDSRTLQKLGNKVSLISSYSGIGSLNCHKVKDSRPWFFLVKIVLKILEIHKKNKIDFIWCNRCYQLIILLPLSKVIGARLVCEIHGPEKKQINLLTNSPKKFFYLLFYSFNEFLLKMANKIVVVEQELAGWLEKDLKVPKDKIVFIGNYPDLSVFKPTGKKLGKDFVVGYLGTLQKGRIDPLLELVAKKKKGYHFIVVGDGEDKNKVLGYKEITHLVENDYQKIPQHIRKFDLGIIFSLSSDVVFSEKGPPIKLFEYLACGVPVIAVNIPNLEPLIDNNRIGLMVEKNELEQGIEKIRKNYSWYKNNVLKFREKMKDLYSWDNEKKKIAQILEGLRSK